MKDFLNIALPKGRLGEKAYRMLEQAGFPCPSAIEPGRKLIFENEELGLRYFWAKPSDVAIYVERGAADVGVVGKDILLEYQPDVYELLDLDIGKCRMAVAARNDFRDDPRKIDIIHLNGSIEIAPVLNLSDVIVDIVETGTTLKENNLKVIETIVPISARLIANQVSCKFKTEPIARMAAALAAQKKENSL